MPGRSRSVGSVLLITSKLDNAAMGLERGAVLHLCRMCSTTACSARVGIHIFEGFGR